MRPASRVTQKPVLRRPSSAPPSVQRAGPACAAGPAGKPARVHRPPARLARRRSGHDDGRGCAPAAPAAGRGSRAPRHGRCRHLLLKRQRRSSAGPALQQAWRPGRSSRPGPPAARSDCAGPMRGQRAAHPHPLEARVVVARGRRSTAGQPGEPVAQSLAAACRSSGRSSGSPSQSPAGRMPARLSGLVRAGKPHQHGFGLVIERVGGEQRCRRRASRHQAAISP